MTPDDVDEPRLIEDPQVALLRLDDDIAAVRLALTAMHGAEEASDTLSFAAGGIQLVLTDLADLVERYLRATGYRELLIGGTRAA